MSPETPLESGSIKTPGKKTHGARGFLINAGIATATVAGTIAGANLFFNMFSPDQQGVSQPSPAVTTEPALPIKAVINPAIEKVPINEETKTIGGGKMWLTLYTATERDPFGWQFSLGKGTLLNLAPDPNDPNSLLALVTLAGDKLTVTDTGEVATNFDGSKTKLKTYEGLTAVVEIPLSAQILVQLTTSTPSNINVATAPNLQFLKDHISNGDTIGIGVDPNALNPGQRKFVLDQLTGLSSQIGAKNDRAKPILSLIATDVSLFRPVDPSELH